MMRRSRKAFTLLELLASVALLVVLGSMLFEIFGKSSEVVAVSNARQEIFQYARASLEFIQREVEGAFTGVDAVIGGSGAGIKGMQIYNSTDIINQNHRVMRTGSQGICMTTGVMARDTRQHYPNTTQANPYFGQDLNVCRVGYYLHDETTHLDCASIYRMEFCDITQLPADVVAESPQGWVSDSGQPFVRNCLLFTIEVMSRFGSGSGRNEWVDSQGNTQTYPVFSTMDWNSDETPQNPSLTYPRRRGMPQALRFTMRLTDETHAPRYNWNPSNNSWYIPGPDPASSTDYSGQEDPVVQSFSEVVYFGRRSD